MSPWRFVRGYRAFLAGFVALFLLPVVRPQAQDPLRYADSNLDAQKLYSADVDQESVDLFRGTLHIEHADVDLPGRYGLDLKIVRWYDSKITDWTSLVGGNCYVYDYAGTTLLGWGGQEAGEVLGYGWRMHMGRFYYQPNRTPLPTPGTLNQTPADFIELPGGKRITFVQSQDSALYPGGGPTGRGIGSEFWLAVYPRLASDPVVVYSPDGTKYTFAASARATGANGYILYNCTTISRGDAAITINYDNKGVANGFCYITSIVDSYGRTVSFSYYRDAIDPLTDPLYRITYPRAGGTTASVDYYYIYNPTGANDIPGYNVDNPTFYTPSLGSLTSPTVITPSQHASFYSLGMVRPQTGYDTWFSYYLGGGNLLANIKFPSGTVSAYKHEFIPRGDFPGTSCYLALTARSKKGDLIAGNATPQSTTRKWTYTYSTTGSSQTLRWRVQVDEPEPVSTVSYFNPLLPLSLWCSTGDCRLDPPSGNGIFQRWRTGLLLQQDTCDRNPSNGALTVRRSTVRGYSSIAYDGTYFPFVNTLNGAQFAEKGFAPILTSEAVTSYYPSGTLSQRREWSNFDQYGNPAQMREYDYAGNVLRTTVTSYAWADTALLKDLWVVRAPRRTTVFAGSTASVLRDTWNSYRTDTSHPGFLAQTREFVNDDGAATSYWQDKDYAYTSAGDVDTVTTTEGYSATMTGALTPVRQVVETKKKGTPVSRQVLGPLGSPSIAVFSRTLDSNGLVPASETVDGTTTFGYDTAGRLISTQPPAFTNNGATVTPRGTVVSYTTSSVTTKLASPDAKQTTYQFDGFGNLARKSRALDSRWVQEDTVVDSLGRTARKYLPCFALGDKGFADYTYDALGRPLTVTLYNAAGVQEARTTYSYDAETSTKRQHVTITSPKSDNSGTYTTTEEWYDSDGNLLQLKDGALAVHGYTYDLLGHLTWVTSGAQDRKYAYNNQGQVLSVIQPETNPTVGTEAAGTYIYDHMGALKTRTFTDGSLIQYGYDFAGRLTEVAFGEGSRIKNYYGTNWPPPSPDPGALCTPAAINSANHLLYQVNFGANGAPLQAYCNSYDSLGRLFKKASVLFNQSFALQYDYNDMGVLDHLTYPSGRVVQVSGVNGAALPTGIVDGTGQTVATNISYGPDLKASSYQLPGGSLVQFNQDTLLRTTDISLSNGGSVLYDASQAYFPSGNLSQQNFRYGTANSATRLLNNSYGYDALHRLLAANISGDAAGSVSYSYDGFGNMTGRTVAGLPAAPSESFTTTYDTRNRKTSGAYDGRGNYLGESASPSFPYTYNQLNQLSGVGPDFAYAYDPQGRRSWSAEGFAWDQTAYFYDESGQLLAEMGSMLALGEPFRPKREYVYAGGRMVAMWTADEPYCVTTSTQPVGGPAAGTITRSPDRACFASNEQARIQLTATANYGFHFLGWTVDGGKDPTNPLTLTVSGSRNVVANFVHDQFCLKTDVSPTGTGTVGLNPPGDCYDSFSAVTATATPATGYHFDHWVVDGTVVSQPTLSLTVDANKQVQAVFASNCPVPPAPVNFGAADGHKDSLSGRYQMLLSWTHAECPYPVLYQVSYKVPSSTTWTSEPPVAAQGGGGSYSLAWYPPAGCQYYDIQLRSQDAGTLAFSAWSATVQQRSTTDAPSTPLNGRVWCETITVKLKLDKLYWEVPLEEACVYSDFLIYRSLDGGQTYSYWVTVPGTGAVSYTYQNRLAGSRQCGTNPEAMYYVQSRIGTLASAPAYLTRTTGPPVPQLLLSAQSLPIPNAAGGGALLADVNGDALLDIILPTTLYLGLPGGGFVDASSQLGTAAAPGDLLQMADMNGDGLPDRVLVHGTTLWIEINASASSAPVRAGGEGTSPLFNRGPSLRLPEAPKALALGPIHAGGPVAAVALFENSFALLSFSSSAGWSIAGTFRHDLEGKALELADLNGDGYADVIVGGDNGATVFFWNSSGQGWTAEPLVRDAEVSSLDIADANGDGWQDIVFALKREDDSQSGKKGEGNDEGSWRLALWLFVPQPGTPPGTAPMPHAWSPIFLDESIQLSNIPQVLFADLLGQDRPGVVVVSSSPGQSAFLSNNGLGTLSPTGWTLAGKVIAAATTDLNHDGWEDLAITKKDRVELYLSNRQPRLKDSETAAGARLRGEQCPERLNALPTAIAASSTAGVSSGKMEEQGPVSVGSLIPGTTLAAKLQSNGFELTTWAGGTTYYLPPGVAVRQVSPSAMAAVTGAWLFPAPDVTGTPRVWVNTAGQVVSKSFTGPYGEELGVFSEPGFSGVGFAGYVSDHATTGLLYTPNRYLGGQGCFLSVDPSGTFNSRDPRTLNQYAYVVGNPLVLQDSAGLGWGSDLADWVDAKVDAGMNIMANSSADPVTYFQVANTATVIKMIADTGRLGEGVVQSYDSFQRGDYLESGIFALQDVGRASNIIVAVGVTGKAVSAALGTTRVGQALNAPLSQLAGGASQGTQLAAKSGSKLAQQIARWRSVGGQGGPSEFLEYASKLAEDAKAAGQSVSGTVGSGPQALTNATIYRRGTEFLVVQNGQVMSYVPQATPGGIVDEFIRLGGQL